MKVVVQRVKQAKCIVDGKVVSSVGQGYMLLVGFNVSDSIKEVEQMAHKVSNLRLFDDLDGKINLNIHDIKGEILSISQFTLYGDVKKSNRPSFTSSMHFEEANKLYQHFNHLLNDEYSIITKPGVFGAHMNLDVECDGPVTILLEY